MNTNYEQEMFDFFTSTENFENLFKIAEQLPQVKLRLVREFWEAVEHAINEKYKNSGWKTARVELFSSNISKLMLYKEAWGLTADDKCPQLAISCERLLSQPFYGPFIHQRVADIDHNAAVVYLRNLEISKQFKKDHETWYPFWTYTELAMDRLEDYQNILPATRQQQVASLTATICNLANELETHLDHIHNNRLRTANSDTTALVSPVTI